VDKHTFESSINLVAEQDVEGVIEARVLYGDSWREEGGFSAFFNIKRKIDRLVRCCKRPLETRGDQARLPFDIFSQIRFDLNDGGETVLDAVRDLRRYLLLTEAFLVQEGVDLPLQRDNLAAALKAQRAEEQVAQEVLHEPSSVSLNDFGRLLAAEEAEFRNRIKLPTHPRGFDPNKDI
jgi:hypothetical protein